MNLYRLKFTSVDDAITILGGRFPLFDDDGKAEDWNGLQSPVSNNSGECLVIVHEPIVLNENNEPLPGVWDGFHADILSPFEAVADFTPFITIPRNPVHTFNT